MFAQNGDLNAHKIVAVFFAFVSGISAVSMAVMPGVMTI